MTNLDEDEQLVLGHARRALSPTDADRIRVRAGAVALIGGVLPAGSGPEQAAAGRHHLSSAIGETTARVVKLVPAALAAVAVAAGAGTVGYRLGFDAGRKVPIAVEARADRTIPTQPIQLNPVPEPPSEHLLPAPSPPPAPRGLSASGPSASARSGLGDELETLKQVDRALREQRPRDALDLLDALDRYAPKGNLGEERAAARTLALCDLRPAAEARVLASEFSKHHPGSVYEPRVVRGCGPPPAGAVGEPTDKGEQNGSKPETHRASQEDIP